MFATQFALLLVSASVSAGSGPSAAPTGGSVEEYGGPPTKWRIRWTNGDASAYTEIYDGAVDPANLITTQNPGVTSFNSQVAGSSSGTFRLRHKKNGQFSAALEVAYGLT